MAGQLATASFDHQHPQAPDNRMQRPNLNARNEISHWIRWEGMQVYVVQEQKTYQLVGGTGNEHWQEIAAGGGASNFVGQFPTFDDLPESGSPGDYAYVGTGDDFVQYNWDQIAGEWRLNSAETKVSDEDFFLGRVPSEPDRVMFSMRRNSIIYSTGGSQSISPDRMANYVFTGENVTLENVNYSGDGGEEFHITNRTGSNLTILSTGNFASGLTIPAGHMASFKSSDDGWVQSFVNEEATFSDTLDSVNAKISTGPDGVEVIEGLVDEVSKKKITFRKTTKFLDGSPMDDTKLGVKYRKVRGDYFVNSEFENNPTINIKDFGAVGDGITDDTDAIQHAFNAAKKTKSNVFAPAGNYVITRTVSMFHGCSFYGAGKKQTIFRPQFSSEFQDEPVFDFFNTDGSQAGLTLKDFEIRGDQNSICGYAFRIDSAATNIIKDIRVLYTGAGALYFTNSWVHWITDCYFGFLGRNDNSVFNEDSILYGVIHHAHSFSANNLVASRVYISNCRYLNGIRTFNSASQFISVIIESLKNGYVFGETSRGARTTKIEGGYFENIHQNGIKVINAYNLTVTGVHNVPSSSDTFMEIGSLNTAEITHVTGREALVSFLPGGYRSNILLKDNYRLMFQDLNLMSGVYVYENNFQLNKSYIPQNLLDNSDDFSGYSTFEETPILTLNQKFLDSTDAYTLESSSANQKLVLSMPSGTITGNACFSIFVKVYSNITSRIELTGNKVGGGYEVINTTVLRVGDGIDREFQNWQRVYVSGDLDHNNIKIKIAGVPRLALARAQWEVGTLVPSDPVIKPLPYVEQDFNSFNFAPKITPNEIDLNELSETGFFLSEGVDSSFLNKPSDGLYAVNYIRPFGWHIQIAYSISTHNVYQRRYWNGSWLEWERINNINSSTTARGIIELATQAEMLSATDTERAVTPKLVGDNYVRKLTPFISAATNYVFTVNSPNRFNVFTGAPGSLTVVSERFISGQIIQGEIEGGAKTFVAGAGVTITPETGKSLIVPSGSKFTLVFLSETESLLFQTPSNRSINRSGSNYTFQESDIGVYIRLTGGDGNATIDQDIFYLGTELQGEIEGGAKTFVAGAGVTLRYPEWGTNVAPTNSRFFIKFKSPNDAQLTIVPSVGGSGAEAFFTSNFTYSGESTTFTLPFVPIDVYYVTVNGVILPLDLIVWYPELDEVEGSENIEIPSPNGEFELEDGDKIMIRFSYKQI